MRIANVSGKRPAELVVAHAEPAHGRVQLARVYDHPLPDGARFLVERLWPRGVSREGLGLDGWLPDVAPSTELRRWFAHRPERWMEFRRRYRTELAANLGALAPLLEAASRGPVVLLYAARDRERNSAVVLADQLARLAAESAERGGAR